MKDYEKKLQESKNRIIECYGKPIPETSGIYAFYREDEDTIKHAYVGQAKHLLTRLAEHLIRYDLYIESSIRVHGLYNIENNRTGYRIFYTQCPESELNIQEHKWVVYMANKGFQLKNRTSGSQDSTKHGIAPNKPPKTYRDGVSQGYENARREVAKLFNTYLKAEINGSQGVRAQNALNKFYDFIKGADK